MKIENNEIIEMSKKEAIAQGLIWSYCSNSEVDSSDEVRKLLAEFDKQQQELDVDDVRLTKLEAEYISAIAEIL